MRVQRYAPYVENELIVFVKLKMLMTIGRITFAFSIMVTRFYYYHAVMTFLNVLLIG